MTHISFFSVVADLLGPYWMAGLDEQQVGWIADHMMNVRACDWKPDRDMLVKRGTDKVSAPITCESCSMIHELWLHNTERTSSS